MRISAANFPPLAGGSAPSVILFLSAVSSLGGRGSGEDVALASAPEVSSGLLVQELLLEMEWKCSLISTMLIHCNM